MSRPDFSYEMHEILYKYKKGISKATGLGEEIVNNSKITNNYRRYVQERAGNPAVVYRAAAAKHRAVAVELEARARRLYGQIGALKRLGKSGESLGLSQRADELMRKADRRRAKADRAEEMARDKNMMMRYSEQFRLGK